MEQCEERILSSVESHKVTHLVLLLMLSKMKDIFILCSLSGRVNLGFLFRNGSVVIRVIPFLCDCVLGMLL